MADWFQAKPTKLLRGMQGLSDDAALAYMKALCLIYENDGRIHVRALQMELPRWRRSRLDKAVEELLRAGKLIGTTTGDLHNDYAMHQLAQLQELTATRASSGGKGGKVRAERERLARKLAERNRSPDLFGPETDPKPAQSDDLTATKSELKSNFERIENDYEAEKANENNGTPQATLKHARAGELELQLERDTPLSGPPIEIDEVEIVEGVVINDAPRGRKQPMPPGWLPTLAGLSEAVGDVVQRWPPDEFENEQVKFVEWAEATDQRFVKWDRAFGNWCMKHETQRRRTGNGRQSGWAQARG